MQEALFYEKLKEGKVQCRLCPRRCTIAEGKRGFCGVRENTSGRLCSLVYGKLCSMNIDPIEKKPLFHFAPGTQCLSICTVGCNLGCKFCQNWEISHPPGGEISGEDVEPEKVVDAAVRHGLPGIAYTYTEPTIAWEFYVEVMRLARKQGLYNVWVSNGYTSPEPARKIARYMDAINVDIKGDAAFYRKLCAIAGDEPIHESLNIYKKAGVWIEITNLLIPGYNDRPGQIGSIAGWVKENLGPDTPMHFSRFYPHYKLDSVQPTPVKTLEAAAGIAEKAGLKWVYTGNVPGNERESTRCPKCREILIRRRGISMAEFREKCSKCGIKIPVAGAKWMK